MDNLAEHRERSIALCQAVIYSVFQIAISILTVFVCLYHYVRGKWQTMVVFSIFVSIDYIAQVAQSLSFMSEGNSIRSHIFYVTSCVGQLGSLVLYLYLIASSLTSYLIRKRKFWTARLHVYSVCAPAAVGIVHTLLAFYYIFFNNNVMIFGVLELLENVLHWLIALISVWNIVLKRKYYKKYINTRCYSWAIVTFFFSNAVVSIPIMMMGDDTYGAFIFQTCVNVVIDLGPMLAFMHFALAYKPSVPNSAISRISVGSDSSFIEVIKR